MQIYIYTYIYIYIYIYIYNICMHKILKPLKIFLSCKLYYNEIFSNVNLLRNQHIILSVNVGRHFKILAT